MFVVSVVRTEPPERDLECQRVSTARWCISSAMALEASTGSVFNLNLSHPTSASQILKQNFEKYLGSCLLIF